MKYFSDKEGFHNGSISFRISADVWNGIAVIVNSLMGNNLLAKDLPKQCPDGNGICGVDEQSFYMAAFAIISGTQNLLPKNGGDIQYLSTNSLFDNPFESKEEIEKKKVCFTYDVLDFIEFTYRHINDVQNGAYHDYFKHYELKFPGTTVAREKFVSDINEILERNYIGFKLYDDGNIQRIVDEVLLHPICSSNKEPRLEELIQNAINRFRSPRLDERRIALEKLWDAFERLKTIEIPEEKRKKQSADILLSKASFGQTPFQAILENECKALTDIGNKYQIRHFEKYTEQILSENHLDYLFYRMYSLISLLLRVL